MSDTNNLFVLAGLEEEEDEYGWDGMPDFEQEDVDAPFFVKVRFKNFDDLREFANKIGQPKLANDIKHLKRNHRSTWYPLKEGMECGSINILRWVDAEEK